MAPQIYAVFLFTAQSLATSVGDFHYFERQDPLDDRLQVGILAVNEKASLSIACFHRRSKTVFISVDPEYSIDKNAKSILYEGVPFRYRVDKNKSHSAYPRDVSYDRAIIEGREARAFADRISDGGSVFIRLPGLDGYIDEKFNVEGIGPLVQRVAERCGDKRLIKRLSSNSR